MYFDKNEVRELHELSAFLFRGLFGFFFFGLFGEVFKFILER